MSEDRIRRLCELQNPCRLCPRKCGAMRAEGETGFCGMANRMVINSSGPHFGEEPQLVGKGGSGTIFMSGCNLGCVFCQNEEISHLGYGDVHDKEALIEIMLRMEIRRCENINFVTPTHFTPQITEAILAARERGLSIPIVYNSGGYENIEVLDAMEGLIDIYMPDAQIFE